MLDDFSRLSVKELLSLYSHALNELCLRGTVRSTNNPAADYAEFLVSSALELNLTGKSNSGYNATDSMGSRYQIKARRITPHNHSRQLSSIRGLGKGRRPFVYLAGVLFNEDFSVLRACQIPFEIVSANSKYVQHVNGWKFHLRDSVWELSGVKDITTELRRVT
jgi:hypothetical protein